MLFDIKVFSLERKMAVVMNYLIVFYYLLDRITTIGADIESPTTLVRNVGQDVKFMWNTTNATATKEVKWGLLKDGYIIPPFIYVGTDGKPTDVLALNNVASSYRGRVSFVGDLSAGHAWFKITNLAVNDTDQYGARIIVEGSIAKIYTSDLTVAVLPTFLGNRPPKQFTIDENKDLSVNCTAVGPPTPNTTWLHNGVPESTGQGSALLNIQTIKRAQSGTYECQAVNNPNEKPVTTQTTIIVQYRPEITNPPSNTTITQGNQILLECNASGLPAPNISWSKKGGIRSEQTSGHKLSILNAKKTDTGKYTCTAKNGVPDEASAHAYVTVQYQPSFLGHSQDLTINESRSLRLTCTADGYPVPTITWSRTPVPLAHAITGSVFDIPSVTRLDAGMYTCTARNGIGKVVADINVSVQYKPQILPSSINHVSSWKNKIITLRCMASGLPSPEITWYKPGGGQITSGVTLITNGSRLTVTTTADDGDYGRYKCQATNTVGSDEHYINVTRIFPPGRPNITINESEIQAVSVTIRWTKPVSDGGSVVTGYKVWINTQPPGEELTKQTHANLAGLTKSTRYTVKVYAGNVAGYGDPAVASFTTKKQGAPSLPILSYNITTGTSVTLYWTKPDENGGEITKYTIYMKDKPEQAGWPKVNDVTATSVSRYEYKVENLVPGHSYTFMVTATNAHGESDKGGSNAITVPLSNIKTTTSTTSTTASEIAPSKDVAVLGVLIAIIVASLLLNVFQFFIICRIKSKGSKSTKNESKRRKAQLRLRSPEPVYDNACELEECAPSSTAASNQRDIPDEQMQLSHTHSHNTANSIPTEITPCSGYEIPCVTAADADKKTPGKDASHYQELTTRCGGQQGEPAKMYEPLRPRDTTNIQHIDQESSTYQPLGFRGGSSDYQTLQYPNESSM